MGKSSNEITAAELDGILDKSFGGYKKDSVVSYIDQLNSAHNNELKAANKLIDDLRAQVMNLKASNEEVFKKLNAVTDNNAAQVQSAVAGRESELKEQIRSLQSQNQTLASQLRDSNQKIRGLQARPATPSVSGNPADLQEKDSLIERLTMENRKQKSRTKQIIAQAKIIVERNEKLKQELADLNTSIGEEKERRESDHSRNQVMNAELQKQNESLNQQVAQLKQEMNDGEYAKLKESIANAEAEMKKLQDTVKALKMENKGLRINADDVAKTNQTLLREGEKYEEEIQSLRKSINQLEGSRNALRKENMKLYAEKLQIIEDM
jgi:chromosome segregation ATPase